MILLQVQSKLYFINRHYLQIGELNLMKVQVFI